MLFIIADEEVVGAVELLGVGGAVVVLLEEVVVLLSAAIGCGVVEGSANWLVSLKSSSDRSWHPLSGWPFFCSKRTKKTRKSQEASSGVGIGYLAAFLARKYKKLGDSSTSS